MNRRGFLAALVAAPAAVVAARAVAEKPTHAQFGRVFIQNSMFISDGRPQYFQMSQQVDPTSWEPSESDPELQALLRENMECLKRGFEENFDLQVYRGL